MTSNEIEVGVGPDFVIQATNFTTTLPDGAVCIRKVDADADNYPPVSVPTFLRKAVELGGEHTALAVKRDSSDEGEAAWTKWTYRQYLDEVEVVARAFIKLGLEPRHGVAIIGFNAPEWFISDVATVFAGGMAAGIYPTNSPEACKHIMVNCKANILVVEDGKQLEKFKAFKDELTDLKAIVQYTGTPAEKGVIAWEDLLAMGRKETNEALNERLKGIAINECCHLVYTSGTTGLPKGVMLSHDNLTYTARRLCHTFDLETQKERLVSYLPLSHVAANICDIFAMIQVQGTVYFADKNALKGTLTQTLREALPTVFFGVPRVWEKMYEKMQEVGRRNKGLKKQIGTWAKKTGLERNMNVLNGRSGASLQFKLADAMVFQKIKTVLGLNKCKFFFSAAAPISKEILEYFMSLDIRILEIYGMSECTGPHLSNTYQVQKLGTIGKELPGWRNKIAYAENSSEKGELCIMGRHVMMGYLFNEEKTKETFDDDGWLKSGDIVTSVEGYFSIAGRIKELIITAGGENIPPVLIEDTIKSELPCISNAIVIGDRRKFLACLLTLKVDFDADTMIPQKTLAPNTLAWLQTIGVNNVQTVEEAMKTPAIGEAIQKGIDRANTRATSSAQRIQKWIVIPVDFSLPGGELGPTLKMKRHVVHEKNSQVIEDFYRS